MGERPAGSHHGRERECLLVCWTPSSPSPRLGPSCLPDPCLCGSLLPLHALVPGFRPLIRPFTSLGLSGPSCRALGSPCARAPSRSPSFHSQLPPGPLGFSFTGCENWTRPPKKQVHGKGGEADTAQVELIHQLTDWVVRTGREFPWGSV